MNIEERIIGSSVRRSRRAAAAAAGGGLRFDHRAHHLPSTHKRKSGILMLVYSAGSPEKCLFGDFQCLKPGPNEPSQQPIETLHLGPPAIEGKGASGYNRKLYFLPQYADVVCRPS